MNYFHFIFCEIPCGIDIPYERHLGNQRLLNPSCPGVPRNKSGGGKLEGQRPHPSSVGNYFLFERPAARSAEGADLGFPGVLCSHACPHIPSNLASPRTKPGLCTLAWDLSEFISQFIWDNLTLCLDFEKEPLSRSKLSPSE